jgi:hypothetical protein
MYERDGTIPANIRIFNKIGSAYGFLTDAAYIVDYQEGIEFILAATVYTNANETFNDGNYEYETIGFPFLHDLGQAIYEVESRREKANRPDLSRFMFDDDQGRSTEALRFYQDLSPAPQWIDRPANTTTHSRARTSQLRANSRKRVMTRLVVRCT